MDDLTARVAEQYKAYAYPTPIDDIADYLRSLQYLQGDPSIYAPLIWPEGQPRRDLRILSAGCGTNQAAILAYTNRTCSVLGIDLSDSSLAHEDYLRQKHGLTNLHLDRRDLREVGELGTFDFIMCTGVLHHMPDPDEGLRALAGALAPDGVVAVMLYGAHARHGIYLLQDVFRTLRLGQSTRDIELIQRLLDELPEQHFVRSVIPKGMRLDHAGIVDTFLHERDTAYTVEQVLAFVRRAGLMFQGWIDNGRYSLRSLPDALRRAAQELPREEQWSVVERATLNIPRHSFLARPEGRPLCHISFEEANWLNWYPVRFPILGVLGPRKFVRNPPGFEVDDFTAAFIHAASGQRTAAEILHEAEFSQWTDTESRARRTCAELWDSSNMFFSKVPVSPRRPGA
jgi:SAM-dependent methyltransferase